MWFGCQRLLFLLRMILYDSILHLYISWWFFCPPTSPLLAHLILKTLACLLQKAVIWNWGKLNIRIYGILVFHTGLLDAVDELIHGFFFFGQNAMCYFFLSIGIVRENCTRGYKVFSFWAECVLSEWLVWPITRGYSCAHPTQIVSMLFYNNKTDQTDQRNHQNHLCRVGSSHYQHMLMEAYLRLSSNGGV